MFVASANALNAEGNYADLTGGSASGHYVTWVGLFGSVILGLALGILSLELIYVLARRSGEGPADL